MSYEGYRQLLCDDGHLTTCDAFDRAEDRPCHCGKPIGWTREIDQTNGDYPYGPYYEPLKVKEEAKWHTCPCCGAKKLIKEETYEIPTMLGTRQ